jgi:four helix bundle protein
MFDALEVSLQLVGALRRPVERLRVRDRGLSEQIRRAASSVALNFAEGRKRIGADRLHSWRIAAGSAEEVRTALRVPLAWGDLAPAEVSEAIQLLDRLLAMAWRLTHR